VTATRSPAILPPVMIDTPRALRRATSTLLSVFLMAGLLPLASGIVLAQDDAPIPGSDAFEAHGDAGSAEAV